ncbi:fatty acid-binding protein DegV (plasmid) [Priestia filamentosa]|uniref:Fatty acid-binding protein DegV n=1 Tax=Priestia filamentosa TaxID=1402861 RepID=A0A2S1M0M1_9BACI|nr:DegV family protein [Priestia filamentosa]AWG44905.1 fatty acid-binding protein DegV [Priestia filamentosa]
MNKVRIVTDSTVDLQDEILKKYDIEVVPLSIHIDGETYLDRIDITPVQFMKKMKESEELPKSSQPSAGAFLELYNRIADEGYDIISIHMTGGMSGTVQSAETAASMSKGKVKVIDSRFISKALAFQVVEAAKMAMEDSSIEEICIELEVIRSKTKLFVVVDTLENLVKGGRLGKGKAFLGSLLNIKPIASLEDGVYTPVTKVRSHTQIVKYLANQLVEDAKGKTIKNVGLVHAEGFELASKLKAAIEELIGYTNISIENTTPIISTHTGTGAIGFMYYLD